MATFSRRLARQILNLSNTLAPANTSPALPCASAQYLITSRDLHRRPTKLNQQELQSSIEQQVKEQQKRNEDAGQMTELVRDFLDPAQFYLSLLRNDISYFCGVPDSLLKDFCAYISANIESDRHVITANEGAAVSVAAGYHMATGKAACVYLQNSGLGNIVNPILSLATTSVYSIPMLLLVGWRGEPGKRDEPQHRVQGAATPGLLASIGIPFQVLPDYEEGAEQVVQTAMQHMETAKGPYCLLVKRQTFLPYKLPKDDNIEFPFNREEALKVVLSTLKDKDVVIGTTGMLSRELFEYRVNQEQGHERDFLTVGSMGHASMIAFGVAGSKPNRQVFCLDGDGAAIMHMGAFSTIGQNAPSNLKHIIINNGAHDSVGGQPTDARNHEEFSFVAIAKACGYRQAMLAVTEDAIRDCMAQLREMDGPAMLEIKVNRGARKDLGRPTRTPIQNKDDFMHFLAIG